MGNYSVTASGAVAGNYDIQYVNGTLSVTQAGLTIRADNKSRNLRVRDCPADRELCWLCQRRHVGQPDNTGGASTTAQQRRQHSITAAGAVSADYIISYVSGTYSVTPAPLTIRADDKTKVVGAANPPLTFTANGFVTATPWPDCRRSRHFSRRPRTSPAGNYPITASGAVAPNYMISYVSGTLRVTAVTAPFSGLLLLDPTGKVSLTVTGNGSIVVSSGGSIVVDSKVTPWRPSYTAMAVSAQRTSISRAALARLAMASSSAPSTTVRRRPIL